MCSRYEIWKARWYRAGSWRDEHEKQHFPTLQDAIAHGLNTSKIFHAWYSAAYAASDACPWELDVALAAARRDNRCRQRIVFVNPESAEDHILPPDLGTPGHARVFPLSPGGISEVARRVFAVAASISTPWR